VVQDGEAIGYLAIPQITPLTRGFPRKYQFMEQNLQRRVVGLKDKLPDIQKTLDTVRFLRLRKVLHCVDKSETQLRTGPNVDV
jgi:ribosomal protein L30/L7E